MKVAALLSGGKDSVAAIEVAQGHGWDVVAAIRLEPAEDDAWMFHTPNLDAVPAMADAMGLPLRSFPTRMDPVEEVADLEAAIAAVHQEFGIDGVISGALASEYQRTRIDAIGHRLGLKTFAPLWHKDPETYLASLAGYDIRFSRVAADGLDESWAGAKLDAAAINALRAKRLHIAGEGGEYETLVLNAPHFHYPLQVLDHAVQATASRATWTATVGPRPSV